MRKKKFIVILFSMIIVLSAGIVYTRNISYSYNNKAEDDKIYLIDTFKKNLDVINDNPDLSLSSDTSNDLAGLYKMEDKYYFRGYVINNYVTLANMTWRIISFNDNEVKVILENGIDNNKEFAFSDDNFITTYDESSIIKELNSWIDKNLSEFGLNIVKAEVLNYEDANAAGASNVTNNESFYLYNGYDTWLSTKKENDLEIESSIIWYLSGDGMIDSAFPEELKTIRPVITIKNPILLDGEGTESLPYSLTK